MIYTSVLDYGDWLDLQACLKASGVRYHLHNSDYEPSIFMVICAERDVLHLAGAIQAACLDCDIKAYFAGMDMLLTGEGLAAGALVALAG